MKRSLAVLAGLAGLLVGCSTTTEIVAHPAHSARGRMGFGVAQSTDAGFGSSFTVFRTGVAGASAAGKEIGGGDYVWRLSNSSTLELCHAAWGASACRTALFDGGPNAFPAFVKVAVYPVLVDPINLGRVQMVSTDAQGSTWVYGSIAHGEDLTTVPVSPGFGVWAIGGGGTIHHCRLEPDAPRCRVAKAAGGASVTGLPVSLKDWDDGGKHWESIWALMGLAIPGQLATSVVACVLASDSNEGPVCKPATLDGAPLTLQNASFFAALGGASGFDTPVLASHLISDQGMRHVVWLMLPDNGTIVRCSAHPGDAPTCVKAQME
jgi:hypothetical protein